MTRRFCSGSSTPLSASRNSSARGHRHEFQRQRVRGLERRPHLVGPHPCATGRYPRTQQVSRSPMARESKRSHHARVHATGKPRQHLAVADLTAARMPPPVQTDAGRRPRRLRSQQCRAQSDAKCRCRSRVWVTSGWNCKPVQSHAPHPPSSATGALSEAAAVNESSGGTSVTRSPWLIQTFELPDRVPAKRSMPSATCVLGRGRTRALWRAPPCLPAAPPWPASRSRYRARARRTSSTAIGHARRCP